MKVAEIRDTGLRDMSTLPISWFYTEIQFLYFMMAMTTNTAVGTLACNDPECTFSRQMVFTEKLL